jgi:RNA ligase (TIGR02306 family)
MSEFHVLVVEIGKFGKHPNADSLSITQVMGDYPCIFRTGDFQTGDKAVYIPVDSLCPAKDPRFSFLTDDELKQWVRVKAKKLRGIFSMGLLIKADPSWEVGTNVQELLGIRKYEPPEEGAHTGGENEKDPGFLPCYTDIEGLRKYKHLLVPGEEVVLTEKIHGANARFVYATGRLWCGSHHQIKKEDQANLWWRAAKKYQLDTILQQAQDIVLYGEVYGQVQDLKYGASPNELYLAFFDAYDPTLGRYMHFHDFKNLLIKLGLPMVPMLYVGPWEEGSLCQLCNGKTTVPTAMQMHCREGFVVRPTTERWDNHVGRVILKMPGEDYLLRKQKD